MRRYKFKRGFLICTVFLLLLNLSTPLSVFSLDNLTGVPYSSSFMPVCNLYPTAEVLPYGNKTVCVCYVRDETHFTHYFFKPVNNLDLTTYFAEMNGETFSYGYKDTAEQLGFFVGFSGPSLTVNIQSSGKIIRVDTVISGSSVVNQKYELGNWVDNSGSTINQYDRTYYTTNGYFHYQALIPSSSPDVASIRKVISEVEYSWNGLTADQCIQKGIISSVNDLFIPYYRACYPDSVINALNSVSNDVQTNRAFLTNYYNSLDSALDTINHNVVVMSNNVDDLQVQVSELQSQLSSQGAEYSSQLNQAQSEIESNANAAASQAADDINNAGEDISDIENDVSDVNGIVSKCSEWVSDLDVFANRIEEAETGVASALENGKTLVNGFLGVSPPIVIALLTFCLCWFVVRKVIGR